MRVHYMDKNENEQLLKGNIKEVTKKAVVITHRPSGTTVKYTKIPYQQIHLIEIVDKELNVEKTILAVGLGGVALIVAFAALIVTTFDPFLGFQ